MAIDLSSAVLYNLSIDWSLDVLSPSLEDRIMEMEATAVDIISKGTDSLVIATILLSIATFFIAVAGTVSAYLTYRSERRRHWITMYARYSDLWSARKSFWDILRKAYDDFRRLHSDAPEVLEDLIEKAGIPPGIGSELLTWPERNLHTLSRSQLLIWNFASCIYPRRSNQQDELFDSSLIKCKANAETFHQARGDLAYFWQVWTPVTSTQFLCKRLEDAYHQLIMLTWLEFALMQRTRSIGRGKTGLFKLTAAMALDRRDKNIHHRSFGSLVCAAFDSVRDLW